MSPSRHRPRRISLALDLARAGWEPETVLAEVQRVWRGVVGDAIAAEATPDRERSGVLTVVCSASVWAQELEMMGPDIVARVNHALGSEAVARLRCVAVGAVR